MTIQNSLKELDIAGLLERERRGFSAPNRLYVKVPEVVKVSLPMTQRNLDVSHKENCTSDLKETLPMTSRKLYPNQININKLKEKPVLARVVLRLCFLCRGKPENSVVIIAHKSSSLFMVFSTPCLQGVVSAVKGSRPPCRNNRGFPFSGSPFSPCLPTCKARRHGWHNHSRKRQYTGSFPQ